MATRVENARLTFALELFCLAFGFLVMMFLSIVVCLLFDKLHVIRDVVC